MEKPSPRYIKHGWLRDNEYNKDLHNFAATMDERNIKSYEPLTTYYTPKEMEQMRQEIKIAECPICFEEINDNSCRVCINGHKFHNICPTLPNVSAVTSCPLCRTENIFLCGLVNSKYNDITSGGKKSKRKNIMTRGKKIKRKSRRIRKSRKH